eukprot:TRINITY_DN6305_c0_g1_i2.p1 TRINITY_DN6305_c0_g1~~TRINITY_DN6305_c0_g1_i2.p1  ORF type:complete len:418 (+),score=94.64 TRINITY_DN6305_c0_g1_i2:1097-2350(+)
MPQKVYDELLDSSLKRVVDSPSSHMTRCPRCSMIIEKLESNPHDPEAQWQLQSSVGSPEAAVNRLKNRFRCRNCDCAFCAECLTTPYHEGETCQEFRDSKLVEKCRFCGSHLPFGTKSKVCSEKECQEREELRCHKKSDTCQHECLGVEGEQICPPCIHPECSREDSQTTEDLCNMCWTEDLGSAPIIQLKCNHFFHYNCVLNTLNKKWPGPRITFGFACCPLCKVPMVPKDPHPQIEFILKSFHELEDELKKRSLNRLKFEEMEKSPEIVDPNGKFHGNPQGFAMDRFVYFMCSECQQPYFAGQRVCEDVGDFDSKELVCGGCSGRDLTDDCPKHGNQFIEYKCKFCCSVASWYCWGNTHFCDACHKRQLNREYLNRIPPNLMPKCQGKEYCPLKIEHPHVTEFCLGCLICRAENM